MNDLQRLLDRCKCSVSLTVNGHRDYYYTIAECMDQYASYDCPPEISEEVMRGILESGNVVDLQFYPDTPIGFYHIVHYSVEGALKLALECLDLVPSESQASDTEAAE